MPTPFEFEPQRIKDVVLVKPLLHEDCRGYFMETYKKSEFEKGGISCNFVQDNQSRSIKGVVRGLHFQKPPFAQAKLVSCLKGSVIDVAVDIRPNSPTFKQYIKVGLSEFNKFMLYIPEGFAHGYLSLEDDTLLSYKVSAEYNPASEAGIIWNDQDIDIDWGIDFEPLLSDKDKKWPTMREVTL